jgi:ribosome-binding ATPase YchF (GTP1/OBG family)
MKITKQQLKRIIKEEKANLLAEQNTPLGLVEQLYAAMEEIGYFHVERGDHSPESQAAAAQVLRDEVEGFIKSALPDAGYR